jgi:hypothetical protein
VVFFFEVLVISMMFKSLTKRELDKDKVAESIIVRALEVTVSLSLPAAKVKH